MGVPALDPPPPPHENARDQGRQTGPERNPSLRARSRDTPAPGILVR